MKNTLSNFKASLVFFFITIVPSIYISAILSNFVFNSIISDTDISYKSMMSILFVIRILANIFITWILIMVVSNFIKKFFSIDQPNVIVITATTLLVFLELILLFQTGTFSPEVISQEKMQFTIIIASLLSYFVFYYFISKFYLNDK
ncbi:MAG TPA: hypothetical protein P5548_00940 [Candidatus Moranbacteria bacterium]|nr:hypothetical protein [Candidatus Moranbacteria bacterium]HRZ33458.1 hypothetical protein [Candidatus Moranbacteria bacterium]